MNLTDLAAKYDDTSLAYDRAVTYHRTMGTARTLLDLCAAGDAKRAAETALLMAQRVAS